MTSEQHPRNMSVNYLTEIGRVITTWAIVDYALMALAADLTLGQPVNAREDEDDSAGVIPYAGMGTRAMVGLIQSLIQVRHQDKGLVEDWKKLGKKINDAKAQRDIIAHCVWGPGSSPDHMMPGGFKTVGGLKGLRDEQIHVSDLTHRAAFNIILSQSVWGWRIKLGYIEAPTEEELADFTAAIPDSPESV